MLLLGLFAGISAAAVPASPASVRVQSRVSVRIVQGARVEGGTSSEPHSRGVARIVETSGERRMIRLVEFQ